MYSWLEHCEITMEYKNGRMLHICDLLIAQMDKQIKQGLTQSTETDQSDICIVNTNNSDQTETSRRQCDPYYHNDS